MVTRIYPSKVYQGNAKFMQKKFKQPVKADFLKLNPKSNQASILQQSASLESELQRSSIMIGDIDETEPEPQISRFNKNV